MEYNDDAGSSADRRRAGNQRENFHHDCKQIFDQQFKDGRLYWTKFGVETPWKNRRGRRYRAFVWTIYLQRCWQIYDSSSNRGLLYVLGIDGSTEIYRDTRTPESLFTPSMGSV